MKRNRTYYCKSCKKCIDFNIDEEYICKCGYVFGVSQNISDYINMRKTWSGQTKIEFSTGTVDDSIKNMNGNK